MTWLQSNISKITGNAANSGLLRMTAWFYMNEMVRDGKTKVINHRDIVLNNIAAEAQDAIYDAQLRFISTSTGSYLPSAQRGAARQIIFDFVLSQLTALNATNKNAVDASKNSRWFSTFKMLQPKKDVGDAANRAKILADLLPSFPVTSAHVQILDQWRQGTYTPLSNIPIKMSQAFNVVKIIYTSSDYTSDARLQIFEATKASFAQSGSLAALTKNTVDTLDNTTDLVIFETVYEIFLDSEESVTVKGSYAAGWNSGVHSAWLAEYKPRIFEDIPKLSKILTFDHFAFFYTNLAPNDEKLEENIAYYEAVKLPGDDMIGHRTNIQKIINGYKLKQALYPLQ